MNEISIIEWIPIVFAVVAVIVAVVLNVIMEKRISKHEKRVTDFLKNKKL